MKCKKCKTDIGNLGFSAVFKHTRTGTVTVEELNGKKIVCYETEFDSETDDQSDNEPVKVAFFCPECDEVLYRDKKTAEKEVLKKIKLGVGGI